MDIEFVKALEDTLQKNRKAILATVVEAVGSVPREAGAKMLVFSDGQTFGTVGGGALEKRVMEEAAKLLPDGSSRFLEWDLEKDLAMKCGGRVKIFLEALSGSGRLVIFGGGHIGKALYGIAPLLGLRPAIVDERPEYCDAQRFPHADRYPLLPEQAAEKLALSCEDCVVIVTHRHLRDLECLRLAIRSSPVYVGMIGSRKKVKETLDRLAAEGVDGETLAGVHAPIGLNLGGRTPGEIAVAIAAEIIAVRKGVTNHGFAW